MNRKRFFTTLATGAAALSMVSPDKVIAAPASKVIIPRGIRTIINSDRALRPIDDTEAILGYLAGDLVFLLEKLTPETGPDGKSLATLKLNLAPKELVAIPLWLQWSEFDKYVQGVSSKYHIGRRLVSCQLNFIDKPEKNGKYSTGEIPRSNSEGGLLDFRMYAYSTPNNHEKFG